MEEFVREITFQRDETCLQCERRCKIPEGGKGVCGTVINKGGRLYTLNYGRIIAAHPDPMEKKPLYHFYPGTLVYSIAAPGCNFRCLFCQNWDISQVDPREFNPPYIPPEEIVRRAEPYGSIAYTYTEPTVFYEYARDVGRLARERGIANVWVSNGYMTEEVVNDMVSFVDAANIDYKGPDELYVKLSGGVREKYVRRNIKLLVKKGIHVEVTTLVIPGWNDDPEFVESVASFLADLSPDIPYHLSRFFPHYKMRDVPPTPPDTLERLWQVARKHLNYVYIGNMPTKHSNTYCPRCGALLIEREGVFFVRSHIKDGKCPKCGLEIPIVWKNPARRD